MTCAELAPKETDPSMMPAGATVEVDADAVGEDVRATDATDRSWRLHPVTARMAAIATSAERVTSTSTVGRTLSFQGVSPWHPGSTAHHADT
jgi:hypothetical protein